MTEAERSVAAKRSLRAFIILAVLLFAMLALDRIDGTSFFGDVDDELRMLQLKHLMVTGGWYDMRLPMIQPQEVYLSPWSRLIDLPYVALTLMLQPFLGSDLALHTATQIWPPMMLLIFIAFTVRTVEALTPPEALSVPVWLLLGFVLIFAAGEFSPGRIDHHNGQILAMIAILYGLVRKEGAGGWLIGLGASLSIVIGLECLPFIAVALALVALSFVLRLPFAAKILAETGATMVLVSLLAGLIFVGPEAMLQTACDAYSAPYVAALCGFGACFYLAARLVSPQAGIAFRLFALALPGFVVALGLALLFPSCLDGPYHMIDPLSRFYWFDRIQQEQSILGFRQLGQTGVAVLVFLALLTLVALFSLPLWQPQTRRSERHWMAFLVVSASLAMTIVLIRYVRFPAALVPVFLPIALRFCVDLFASPRARRAKAFVTVPVIVISAVVAGLYAFLPYRPQEQDAVWLMSIDDCRGDDFAELRGLAPGRILAPTGIGLALAAHVPEGVSVMAIPFHRAAPGIKASFTAFAGSDESARNAALQSSDYVAVCELPFAVPSEQGPLYAALAGGKAWPGLEPLAASEPGRLRLYKVTHNRSN